MYSRSPAILPNIRTPPKLLHLPHSFIDTRMPLRHGRSHRPESTDRTYRHRKCKTFVVRSASGAQCAETESPYALYSLPHHHHRGKKIPPTFGLYNCPRVPSLKAICNVICATYMRAGYSPYTRPRWKCCILCAHSSQGPLSTTKPV